MQLFFLCIFLPHLAHGLNAYGHAYSRPDDFTAAQYAKIASDFSIFTVEKDHAVNVYGNSSAKPPFKTNSIAATVGTARNIKALNASVKVLMYWNSAIFFNFYECESEVEASWVYPDPHVKHRVLYNYSVPAFRQWWVRCAVASVQNNKGDLDGLFLDATPKVDAHITEWNAMVDQVRKRLGPEATIINNGFYGHADRHIAGAEAWVHSGICYTESAIGIGDARIFTPEQSIDYLSWLANSSSANPHLTLVGHGNSADQATFTFSLANYLLVAESSLNGWFLANSGSYSIDGGLLDQHAGKVYQGADGVGCGEPTAPFKRVGGASVHKLQRTFEHGAVTVDLDANTALITCNKHGD
jgi:hypothetical protein